MTLPNRQYRSRRKKGKSVEKNEKCITKGDVTTKFQKKDVRSLHWEMKLIGFVLHTIELLVCKFGMKIKKQTLHKYVLFCVLCGNIKEENMTS